MNTQSLPNPTETPVTRWLRPAVDVLRSDDGALLVVLDVPGVRRDAVELTVDAGVLTVAARRAPALGYRWSLRLPEAVEPERTEAKLADGVLEITLRRPQKAEARRIPVS